MCSIRKYHASLQHVLEMDFMVFVLTMFGKFGFTSTYTGVFVFAAELYPTPLRNVGVGACNMLAGLGTMTSPYFGKPLVHIHVVTNCIRIQFVCVIIHRKYYIIIIIVCNTWFLGNNYVRI